MGRIIIALVLVLLATAAEAGREPTIKIIGNSTFATDRIRDEALAGKTLVEPSGAISQEAVEHFTLSIAAFYWDRGYAQVKVAEPVIDAVNHQLVYSVVEGPTFTLGALKVTGKLIESERKVMALVTLKTGDVFSRKRIADDRLRLQRFYEDRGYAYANVLPLTKVDLAGRTIAITFEVEPGEPSYIEAIEIFGNTRTSTATILGEMQIAVGQAWHGSRSEASRMRLKHLFREVVYAVKRGSKPGAVRVVVEVDE